MPPPSSGPVPLADIRHATAAVDPALPLYQVRTFDDLVEGSLSARRGLTIILTLTPVVTWLWSIALFGGRPTAVEIVGGIATLVGVLLVTASRSGFLAARLR